MFVRAMTAGILLAALAGTATRASAGRARQVSRQHDHDLQNCHTPKGERGAPIFERDLSSGLSWDEPPFKVTASNITQDKETGIGAWSDDQIKTALRKGARPNGVSLPRSCVRLLRSSHARRSRRIVAYLRTVKPVKQETPTPEYRIALPRHIPPGAEKPFPKPT